MGSERRYVVCRDREDGQGRQYRVAPWSGAVTGELGQAHKFTRQEMRCNLDAEAPEWFAIPLRPKGQAKRPKAVAHAAHLEIVNRLHKELGAARVEVERLKDSNTRIYNEGFTAEGQMRDERDAAVARCEELRVEVEALRFSHVKSVREADVLRSERDEWLRRAQGVATRVTEDRDALRRELSEAYERAAKVVTDWLENEQDRRQACEIRDAIRALATTPAPVDDEEPHPSSLKAAWSQVEGYKARIAELRDLVATLSAERDARSLDIHRETDRARKEQRETDASIFDHLLPGILITGAEAAESIRMAGRMAIRAGGPSTVETEERERCTSFHNGRGCDLPSGHGGDWHSQQGGCWPIAPTESAPVEMCGVATTIGPNVVVCDKLKGHDDLHQGVGRIGFRGPGDAESIAPTDDEGA